MTAANPFLVPVSDLLRKHGASRSIVVEAPVDWHVELSAVEQDPPLHADLVATRVTGGILFRGTVSFRVEHTCHRCLEPTVEDAATEAVQLFSDRLEVDGDDEYVLDGDIADLEQMLRDEVLLSMPLLPTCEPECPQLVEGHGSGLNTAAPDDDVGGSSPFAVLEDLLGD